VGLARCRFSSLEHVRAVPTIETLERIADALEIPAFDPVTSHLKRRPEYGDSQLANVVQYNRRREPDA
jgi:transcriptional regulator with XRE-family HTH domain